MNRWLVTLLIVSVLIVLYGCKQPQDEPLKTDEPDPIHVVVDVVVDNKFDTDQMEQIHLGEQNNVDVAIYSNPDLSSEQMEQLRLGLEQGVDVDLYNSPSIQPSKMSVIRQGLVASDELDNNDTNLTTDDMIDMLKE